MALISLALLTLALRMSALPKSGASVVPNELKAWVKFRRLEASEPTSNSNVRVGRNLQRHDSGCQHHERGKEERKRGNARSRNKHQRPNPMVSSPATMVPL